MKLTNRFPASLTSILFLLTGLAGSSVHGQTAGVLREVFSNIAGSALSDLTNNAAFPSRPSLESIEPDFEAPAQVDDNYGQRLRALLVPPQTGAYTFWIASDDQSALLLSPDENPGNRKSIANVPQWTNAREWTKFTSQKSAPIQLEAGRRYYIEALQKEGGGGDNLAVRWQLPDGQIIEPIRGTNLIPVGLSAPEILTQPANATVVEHQAGSFSVSLSRYLNAAFQWQRNGIDLPEETNSVLQLAPVELSDSGTSFRVVVTNPQGSATSMGALLKVTPDITPPAILSVSTLSDSQTVTIAFSEPVDPATAGNVVNYVLDQGAKVLRARLLEDGRSAILATTPLTQGVNYTLTVSGVRDRAASPNVITLNSHESFQFDFITLNRAQRSGASEPLGPSTRRTGLVISEIMYHPADRADGRNLEFLELYNSEAWFVDISGFRLSGSVDYFFPEGTVLPSRSFLVLAASPVDLAAVHGLTGIHGYSGSLPNGTGVVRLHNRQGAVLWEVDYSDEAPWPAAADGAGHSLVLARPSLGQRDPRAWSASDQPGGSPGILESASPNAHAGLFLNEILALPSAGQEGFLELFNYTDAVMSLAGLALTDDPSADKFLFAPDARVAAHGFLTIPQSRLGFPLAAKGGTLLLREASSGRVIDAVRFSAQAAGISSGRSPDGAEEFALLAAATPGVPNTRALRSNVVINEIMYDPPSGESADEFIELHNRATQPVSLAGWRLAGDISFTFDQAASIPAGGYFVVGKSAARLRVAYPQLNDANSDGDYTGALKNGRGRVRLLRQENPGAPAKDAIHVPVDEVSYVSGGRWGKWSGGGGSSLELIDPRADGRFAPNWADSNESQRSGWVTIEATGVLDNGNGTADSLQVFLLGAGECLVDNVEVFRRGSTNLIANATFDSGISTWVPQGNQVYSSWEPSGGIDGSGCLHLRATGRGDTGANRVRVPLRASLPSSQTATIRAKVRWLKGSQFILLRLHGNWLEATGNILTTRALGTPGLPNSRALVNAPPAITDVTHTPALPSAKQAVTVSARIDDPDGLAALHLNYRIDPSTNYTRVAMRPRGAGLFAATIPGQEANVLAAYYIEASDNSDQPMGSRFPNDAPQRECLVRFGEPSGKGNFGNYHFWITQATVSKWSKREQLSNDPLDATFVYGNNRVVYNIGAQYSGSPYHSPSYNSPLGANCDYVLVFPSDDPLLGDTDVNLILPGNGCCEGSVQRESTAYWVADQLGLPFNYSRPVHVYANGQHRAPILTLDLQQANGDFVEQWWPDSNQGDLHKIQLWFEFDNRASGFQPVGADFGNYTTPVNSGVKKLARYRWNWARRSDTGDINNYTNMFALHDLMLTAATGTNYTRQIEAGIDFENWVRTVAVEHIVGNPDSFAYGGGQNMYIYKPEGDRWSWIIWDIDFAFSAEAATTSVFQFGGGALNRFMNHPPFRRAFYRALQDAADGPLAPENSTPLLDAKYQAFRGTGFNPESPNAIKTYIATRRKYLTNQLAKVQADFRVTTAPVVATSSGLAVISGTAPIRVTTIQVNGKPWPVNWTGLTNWTLRLQVRPGSTQMVFDALDSKDRLIATAPETVTVTSTGKPDPAAGKVFINEWMSSNKKALTDPADNQFEDWIELFNASGSSVNLSGYWVSDDPEERTQWAFPANTILPPHGFLLLWADGQPEQTVPGALHLPFKLSSAGGFIGLFGPGGLEIDSVDYFPQTADASSGRYPDGAHPHQRLSRPTPLAPNAPALAVQPPPLRTFWDSTASSFVLSWITQSGTSYRIEFTDDLANPVWRPASGTLSGDGAARNLTLPADAAAARFYRIVAE